MTPIPERMKKLPLARRGYPIPFIVFRTSDGRAHFTINDSAKVDLAAKKQLCGVCGTRLYRGERWFVGGPMSAFHAHGAYIDGPVHKECGTFALENCPYLAAPSYARRIDDRTVNPETLGDSVVLLDPTMLPDRPELFVFACAKDYKFDSNRIFHPKRPWIMHEFWSKGTKLTDGQAVPLIEADFARHRAQFGA